MNEAKQATPHSELIEQLMDSRVPKTEREHAARREIEMLREALRLPAALGEPEQEPVALMDAPLLLNGQPLYTRPQPAAPREWVGLTAKDLAEIPPSCFEGAIWADAKLKEKNT